MTFLPYIHTFNIFTYLTLGIVILIKNPKGTLNRICALFLLCFAIWSLSMVFIHNPVSTRETAIFWANIGALGWVGFSSLFLWFSLVFAGKTEILKKVWVVLGLIVIPVILLFAQWTGKLFVDFFKTDYGWKPFYGKSAWPIVLLIYIVIFMGAGLRIFFQLSRDKKKPELNKQAKIVFQITLLSLILGGLVDMILPIINVHFIPNIADTVGIAWAIGSVYAIVKYKFLMITPASAADNIISTMQECLIILDCQGIISMVNRSALSLLGYEEKELLGTSVDLLFDGNESKKSVFNKIIGGRNIKNTELLLKSKEGESIPVSFSCSLLKTNTGVPDGIVCVANDISEQKKLEEEIFKIKKLESLGILAGGIAHDFNNLLSAVIGNISLAISMASLEEKSHRYLLKSEKAALKAAELAKKFLTFSPGGWLNKERLNIIPLLDNLCNAISPAMKIQCNVTHAKGLMDVYGDQDQLSQALDNILLNAVEAMPVGGFIFIHSENCFIELGNKMLLNSGWYVKISIKDNGMGISPNFLDKIFDPYFSTKNKVNQKGMGLGLTICYSILKKHEGHIAVESESDQGTTVTLYIPTYASDLSN